MTRADRLFQLVQVLRRDRFTTAEKLARELGVTPRTIYRDIQELSRSGVPIEGEAGVGYRLPTRFDLPPLTLSFDEAEALVMGARMVSAWADEGLKRAATSLLSKIENVLPEDRKGFRELPLMVPDFHVPKEIVAYVGELRGAIRERRKLHLDYVRADGERAVRVVRPLGLAFWGDRWNLVGWCELRQAFRIFRPDRIQSLIVLNEAFPVEPGRTLEDFIQEMEQETKHS